MPAPDLQQKLLILCTNYHQNRSEFFRSLATLARQNEINITLNMIAIDWYMSLFSFVSASTCNKNN